MVHDLWGLLTTEEEKETARLVIEKGVVTFSDDRVEERWTAVLDYYHDDRPVQAGGFGETPEEAYADLFRMVQLGKRHEQEHIAVSLGRTPSVFLENEPF